MLGKRFYNDAKIPIIGFDSKYGCSAHAIKRLNNDISMFMMKRPYLPCISRDKYRWAAVSKLCGKDFFITVTQALRLVDNQSTLLLRCIEEERGV